MQTLELAQILQDTGYGEEGEIMGFDLYPYTEDQLAAVRRAILQWEFVWDLATKIDRTGLREAKNLADALAGQKVVYAALGMNEDYEAEISNRRKEARASRREV
jgi:xylose isomerase